MHEHKIRAKLIKPFSFKSKASCLERRIVSLKNSSLVICNNDDVVLTRFHFNLYFIKSYVTQMR